MREQIVEKFPIIENYYGGMNIGVDRQMLSLSEARLAVNVNVDDGTLKLAKGYVATEGDGMPKGDKTLMKHFDGDDVQTLVAVEDKIYRKDDGKYVVIKSGLKSHEFTYVNYQIDMDEVTIMTNGVDPVYIYDGKNFRTAKYEGIDSDTEAPKGKYITLHKERVWISGNLENPNTIYFSKDFDPDNWVAPVDDIYANTGGGEINIPTWDGGIIIGMKSLFDDVVIFKTKNVYRVFGTYPGNFTTVQVFDTVDGDILHNTIASLDNTVYWANSNGIHVFNGTNAAKISQNIQPIFDELNKEHMQKACATIHGGKYIISFPTGDSDKNNTVFEYDLERNYYIKREGIEIASFLSVVNDLFFANYEDDMYQYGVGYTYDGKPIHAKWISGFHHFGEQQAVKIVNRVYFTGEGTGGVKVTIDTERKTVSKVLDLSDGPKFIRERLRNKGRLIQVTLENTDGCEFKVNQFQFMVDVDYD